MAVVKRRTKKANLHHLASGSQIIQPSMVLEEAKKKGIKTVPLDIERLADSLGIRIKTKPMDDEISGHLALTSTGWEITVNSLHHPRRQRFTVAHEIGHYMLHRRECQQFLDKKLFRKDSNPMEAQANYYAAELLMPESDFRNFVKEISSTIENLAEYFGVSAMAVRVRAKTLGFKGHGL